MKRIGSLVVWAVLAAVVYCYVVRWPNPEFWQWITH